MRIFFSFIHISTDDHNYNHYFFKKFLSCTLYWKIAYNFQKTYYITYIYFREKQEDFPINSLYKLCTNSKETMYFNGDLGVFNCVRLLNEMTYQNKVRSKKILKMLYSIKKHHTNKHHTSMIHFEAGQRFGKLRRISINLI